MNNLKELNLLYSTEGTALRSQQELLRNVLEPVLYNRYREKFASLQLDENFLVECQVSIPYEKRTRKDIDEDWNTSVKFTFPSKHPVLKGVLEVAYTRTSIKDFFNHPVFDDFTREEVIEMTKDEYLAWWYKRLCDKLGNYFKKYGAVTTCNYGDWLNPSGKTIIVQVPSLSVIDNYFSSTIDKDYEKYWDFVPTFGLFECKIYTVNDYALLREKESFEFTIHRTYPE